jgi:hypothetical protein
LEVGIGRKGVEIQVRKLIFGAMPPQVEHPTLVERASIKPYMRNDMFHMMLETKYTVLVILAHEMSYLVHRFQIC